jgi:uncharacterized membrane protein
MWLYLAFLSFLFNGLCAFCYKINAMKKGSTEGLLFGFFLTGSLGSILFTWYTHAWQWNSSILIAGIIIGFGVSIGNFLYSKAVQIGPAGLTAMISHSNVVLIIFMSLLIYEERLSLLESIAVVLLILAVLLLPFDPNQTLRIQNRMWYLFVGIAFLCFFVRNGGVKITEEMQLNNASIILLSYLFGFGWYTAILLFNKKNRSPATKIGIPIGLLAGLCSFITMQTFASALSIGPASIISPIASANGVIVALLAYFVYKERFSKFQIISFCLLLIGIIFLQI